MLLGAAVLAACSPGSIDEQAGDAAGTVASEACRPQWIEEPAPSGMEQARLCIGTGADAHAFTVEMARTGPEQARGLMFRRSLEPDAGMLFPFDPPRNASFWMSNTYIPLDMVFVTPDGRIESIIADVEPLTLDSRRSQGAVSAVLELPAGRAAELGLSPGDPVRWPR